MLGGEGICILFEYVVEIGLAFKATQKCHFFDLVLSGLQKLLSVFTSDDVYVICQSAAGDALKFPHEVVLAQSHSCCHLFHSQLSLDVLLNKSNGCMDPCLRRFFFSGLGGLGFAVATAQQQKDIQDRQLYGGAFEGVLGGAFTDEFLKQKFKPFISDQRFKMYRADVDVVIFTKAVIDDKTKVF